MLLLGAILLFQFPQTPTVEGSYCTKNDKDFLEYRYAESIPVCKRNVSTPRKNRICERDGITDRTDFTVDHLIPLSFGGSNHDDNLWCQHKSLNSAAIEYEIFKRLENDEVTREEAVKEVLDFKFDRKYWINNEISI